MLKKVGLTEKPGHLLKFTKALATRSLAVDGNTGGNSNTRRLVLKKTVFLRGRVR